MALFPKDCLEPQEGPQTQPNWPGPGGRKATLVCFLLELELGSVKGLDENPGIWFICWEEVEQGGGAKMGSSLKEGC